MIQEIDNEGKLEKGVGRIRACESPASRIVKWEVKCEMGSRGAQRITPISRKAAFDAYQTEGIHN